MERELETAEVIELGTASVETQGPLGVLNDQQLAIQTGGLSDD